MIIKNINPWNNKLYEYDSDDYDLSSPMFNREVHNNNIIPQIINPHICGYCFVSFDSRNKLFYHLGYNNINTSPHTSPHTSPRYKRRINHTTPTNSPSKRFRIEDLDKICGCMNKRLNFNN
jgi:hypothetical protein